MQGKAADNRPLWSGPFPELRASRELSAPGCPSLTGVLALSLTVFAVNSGTLLMTYYKVFLTNDYLKKFLFSTWNCLIFQVSIKQFSSCELQGSCGLKILVKVVAFLLTESKVSIMVATKLILVKEKHLQVMTNFSLICLHVLAYLFHKIYYYI